MPDARKTTIGKRQEVTGREHEYDSDECQKNLFHILYHTESRDFTKFLITQIFYFRKERIFSHIMVIFSAVSE